MGTVGAVLFLIVSSISGTDRGPILWLLGLLLSIVAIGGYGFAIMCVALKKGRSPYWAIFGILFYGGLLIPPLLFDKSFARRLRHREIGKRLSEVPEMGQWLLHRECAACGIKSHNSANICWECGYVPWLEHLVLYVSSPLLFVIPLVLGGLGAALIDYEAVNKDEVSLASAFGSLLAFISFLWFLILFRALALMCFYTVTEILFVRPFVRMVQRGDPSLVDEQMTLSVGEHRASDAEHENVVAFLKNLESS